MPNTKRPRAQQSFAVPALFVLGLSLVLPPSGAAAQQSTGTAAPGTAAGPYHVLQTAKVGGDGGWDYVYADTDTRQLYIARGGSAPRVTVFNLDTLAPAGVIPGTDAHGVAADTQSHHAFASSNPVALWDTRTLTLLKTIPVQGDPDGILNDTFNHRTYVLSHEAPNVTVLNDADGAVLGTIDLGGAPEQAATDGKGRVYVDIEDKARVAVIDARTMKVLTTYSLNGKGSGDAGLALDTKKHVLFVACRDPQVMVMLDSRTGKYLADLPIGRGCDGATFNPKTGECFASFGDGTLSVIKQTGPASFAVEQVVQTMPGARTLTLDTKTGKVMVISAAFGPAPDAAAGGGEGGRYRRGPMLAGSFSILAIGK